MHPISAHRRELLSSALGGLACGLVPDSAARAAPPAPPFATIGRDAHAARALVEELASLAGGTGGIMGISLLHLESGRRVSIRGNERFRSESTLKVAVAGALLAKVDLEVVGLDEMVDVPESMLMPGSIVSSYFVRPGVSISVGNLLELMLVFSDNTATDVLTRFIGGPSAATAWVRAQGVMDQRIDRDTLGHMRDFFGFGPGSYREASGALAAVNPDVWSIGRYPNPAYEDDPRDSTTPNAMVGLLARIARGEVLSPSSTRRLLQTMGRCNTGAMRIPALLPKGTPVAYRTGTMGCNVNAAGIVALPAARGRFAIAAYIKKSDRPRTDVERAIAMVSRAAYDYFTLEHV